MINETMQENLCQKYLYNFDNVLILDLNNILCDYTYSKLNNLLIDNINIELSEFNVELNPVFKEFK